MFIRAGTVYADDNTVLTAVYWREGNIIKLHHNRISRDMYDELKKMVNGEEEAVKQYFDFYECESWI